MKAVRTVAAIGIIFLAVEIIPHLEFEFGTLRQAYNEVEEGLDTDAQAARLEAQTTMGMIRRSLEAAKVGGRPCRTMKDLFDVDKADELKAQTYYTWRSYSWTNSFTREGRYRGKITAAANAKAPRVVLDCSSSPAQVKTYR